MATVTALAAVTANIVLQWPSKNNEGCSWPRKATDEELEKGKEGGVLHIPLEQMLVKLSQGHDELKVGLILIQSMIYYILGISSCHTCNISFECHLGSSQFERQNSVKVYVTHCT